MSVPSNFFVDLNTPNLFSFSIPTNAGSSNLNQSLVEFKKNIDFLNKLISGKNVFGYEVASCKESLWKALGKCKSSSKEDMNQNIVRIRLSLYILYTNISILKDNDLAKSCFDNAEAAFNALSHPTEEMLWYYAALLKYKADASNTYDFELIAKTIKCIENIKSKKHRETLAYFIHQQYYPKLTEYPTYEPLQRLEQLLPRLPYKLDAHCVKQRHNFVTRLLKNKDYFDGQDSTLLHKTTLSGKQTLKLNIPVSESVLSKNVIIQIAVDQYDLFQFSAHIGSPTPPILRISAPELSSSKKEKEFHVYLLQKLRTAKFCNGEGFLNTSLFSRKEIKNRFKDRIQDEEVLLRRVNVEIQEIFNTFRTIIFQALVVFYENEKICLFSNEHQKNEFREQFYKTFTEESILPQLKKLNKMRKSLTGFNGLDAAFLFHESLMNKQYGLEPNLLAHVKSTVHGCLELIYHAREANKISYIKDKCEKWLLISNNVVQSLKTNPRNILIQVGTPIQEGKSFSTHAIYVAIKYLPESKKFQIIITNGGSHVDQFHPTSPTQHPKDREEYCYVAFEPFDINDPKKEAALVNYVYLLLSIEYRMGVNDDPENEDNPDSYLNLLRSVYLRETKPRSARPEMFIGYQYKEFKDFKRQDLDQTFLSQFTGNCTVHNLKKSLQILFDMDQLTFGLLEDNLLLGLDQVISDFATLKLNSTTTTSSHNTSTIKTDTRDSTNTDFINPTEQLEAIQEIYPFQDTSNPQNTNTASFTPGYVALVSSSGDLSPYVQQQDKVLLEMNLADSVKSHQQENIKFKRLEKQ